MDILDNNIYFSNDGDFIFMILTDVFDQSLLEVLVLDS